MSDGQKTDQKTLTVTVNDVNQNPVVGSIPSLTVNEGANFAAFDLDDYVSDPDMDTLTWFYTGNNVLIVNISQGNIVTVTQPNPDWHGAETIRFTAIDSFESMGAANVQFTVTSVNDVPIITSTPVTNAAQGIGYTYQLTATDADNDSVSINSNLSTYAGISFSQLNWIQSTGLTMTAVPPQVGTFPVHLVVSDGQANSLPQEFNLTVSPTLEILRNTILMGSTVYDERTGFNVTPGQTVTVNFQFQNNLNIIDTWLGNLEILAASNQLPDFVDHQRNGFIFRALSDSDSFTFTVPQNIDGNFNVAISLSGEDSEQNNYSDAYTLTFNVQKEVRSIYLDTDSLEIKDKIMQIKKARQKTRGCFAVVKY